MISRIDSLFPSVCLDEYAHKQIPVVSFPSSETFQSSFWYSTGFSITSKYTIVFTCAGFAWYFSIEGSLVKDRP